MAALIVGGGTQILLISYEQFWLKENLDSISPYLTEHGVLVGLTLSALFFVGVSLATRPQPDIRLAIFFPDIAEKVFCRDLPRADRKSARYMDVASLIEEKIAGERSHLNLAISHCDSRRGVSRGRTGGAALGAFCSGAQGEASPLVYAHGKPHRLPSLPGGHAGLCQDGARR